MASALIHLAVSAQVNKTLKVDNEKHFYLGAIAPDIAKMVGSTRNKSHFIESNLKGEFPNVELFLKKYKRYLDNPYEMGYYIHLLTDVLWFKEFLPNFVKEDCLVNDAGELIHFEESELIEILYEDYTSLNPKILSSYNLDLSLFYEKFPFPESHIEEVGSEYFDAVIEKFGMLCLNEQSTSYVLKFDRITHFIEYATTYCLDELKRNFLI